MYVMAAPWIEGDFIKLWEKEKSERQNPFSPPSPPYQDMVGKTLVERVTGMKFIWVKGGCYEMGCGYWTSDCFSNEKPVHEVCVDSFWIGKYEVTQRQWKTIMGNNPSSYKIGDDYPVEQVSWDDIGFFIKRLYKQSDKSYRLPTEAEWEFAARSRGKKEKYAGGITPDSLAWYGKNSGMTTHPVGTKQPNGLNIHDMSGNVMEWCFDRHDYEYYRNSPRNNPAGPPSGAYRVIRGGSWMAFPSYLRTTAREVGSPEFRNGNLGFRLVIPHQ